jgi:hypothetical protein
MRKQRPLCFLLLALITAAFLWGCPKRVPPPEPLPPPEKPALVNPMIKIFEAFASADTAQARASIRIDTVRDREEQSFLLNGMLLYEKPEKLRIIGFHPLGMNVFDAIYDQGSFFVVSPLQRKVYIGEVSKFEDFMEKIGPMVVTTEKGKWNDLPGRILIDIVEKKTLIDLRLREVAFNPTLPPDSFKTVVPEGVDVIPVERLLKPKPGAEDGSRRPGKRN